jgi:glycosyltransferase involved in cell wall biosynthesis
MKPELSLVVPVYNEAGNLTPLIRSAAATLQALHRPHEIILVNDGSTDGTADEIAALAQAFPACRELRLERNQGQARALLAGLRVAQGEYLLTMDGDGQNDPRDFPGLLELVESGHCDLACGWRVDRHDSLLRKIMSRLANTVRRTLLQDQVHDAGCQLRVMRSVVRTAFEPMELMQSFIPALAAGAGFRIAEKPVRHHARYHGESKYGLGRLWWRPAVAMLALRWRLWRRKKS